MGILDTSNGSPASQRHARRRRRRLGIRIDMTPMVDVAFLLLTFFMLTTVFSRPQTLEIGIPESNARVFVNQRNVVTLRVAADGTLLMSQGNGSPRVVTLEQVGPLLAARQKASPGLTTVLKIDREGRYEMAVDILDEFALAGITRFTIAPMLPSDIELIRKTQGG